MNSAGVQFSGNIRWVLSQCCNVWDIQGKFREHFKENFFWKVLNGKVVFVLKVYDLIITNVYLLANSSNRKVMFPEYSWNTPRMSVSKIFQRYPQNIVKLWKYFYKSKSSKNCFAGYTVKILKLAVSSLAIFFWTLLKPFYI